MPFSYRDWIFGGKTFCCCLPVRLGVITMSVLGILVAGLLSIILWFEGTAPNLTGGERAPFVIAGIVETLLFVGSILGFVGAIVRKQTFLQTYTYFLYFHFFLNVAAAVYLFVVLSKFQETANRVACGQAITNADAQEDCRGFFRFTATVFIVVVAIVLFIEMYGAIIATRYLNLIKREKRMIRESKRATDSAFSLRPMNRSFYGDPQDTQIYSPLNQQHDEEFDPYVESSRAQNHSRSATAYTSSTDHADGLDVSRPPMPIEEGYGGGWWTHREISAEEKQRMERAEEGSVTIRVEDLSQEEMDRRRLDFKSPYGPPSTQEPEGDALPQYVAFPSPRTQNAPTPQQPPQVDPGQPEPLLR